ncbi:MAG: trypsin-like peptidase domain-containing protein [Patescibacteria group bacterium]
MYSILNKLEKSQNTVKSNSPSRLKNTKQFRNIFVLILICFFAGFFGGWLGSQTQNFGLGSVNNGSSNAQKIVLKESEVISEIAKQVGPSVVSVNVTSESSRADSFFGFRSPAQQQSAGTGFILTKEGVVVTNRHVVPRGATTVSVTLSDGTELTDVEVIGRTNDNDPLDVAFLRIKDTKNKELKPVTIGDSAKMQVGDKVIAIGNALGQFQNTVTSGIISGYGRSIEAAGDGNTVETLQNLFQTDTAINQGNSGGPLVNINGEVIGINTAVAGGAENIGFAIPVNDIQGLIKSVLSKGKLERPYLGVRYVTLTDDYAYQFNLEIKRGAYLAPSRNGAAIIAGSPAEKAGLKEKDIITKIDNQPIDENNSLISLIGKKSVGDSVELTVIRDGKEQKIKAILETAPSQ